MNTKTLDGYQSQSSPELHVQLAIPESHTSVLRKRLEELRSNPQSGRPWHEVREQLLVKPKSL